MKELIILLVAAAVTCSCGHGPAARRGFTVEAMNKITPVKNQGRGPLCWIYAMLATVESDRLMQGDSVNLSAVYVARRVLEAEAERMYLSQGLTGVAVDGMAPRALSALAEYGVVTYDAYRSCHHSLPFSASTSFFRALIMDSAFIPASFISPCAI